MRMKQKLEKQFTLVPIVIAIYVKQMIIMFVLKVLLYSIEEKEFNRSEKSIAYLFVVLYYILYFNSAYKFAMSFYNILKNALIDDRELMMIELGFNFVFGLLYLLYGVLYQTVYHSPGN